MSIASTETPNGQQTGIVERKVYPKEVRVVQDNGPLSHLFDTARFEHLQRIALLMASASLMPEHLKGKSKEETVGNCFLVVDQSIRWGMDPFAVASETYAIRGKLGFQGKLVAAVVNSRAGLSNRLSYLFSGKGDDLTVTVSGKFDGEHAPRTITLSVGQAKTDNKMWKVDPEQKLVYSGATKWARRHCPEVLLGVLTEDDLERIRDQAVAELESRPRTLGDLTARLGESLTAQSEPAKPDPLANIDVVLSKCKGINDVNDLETELLEATEPPLNADQRVIVKSKCEAARQAIRGSRGQASNREPGDEDDAPDGALFATQDGVGQ